MKPILLIPVLLSLLFIGCKYDAPLTETHDLPINPALLGLWDQVPEKPDQKTHQLLILQFSKTEYLIQHPAEKTGILYRAYPIEIGGIACVQLEAIGTGEAHLEENVTKRYLVASYELKQETLTVRILNSDHVKDSLKTTAELKAAFLQHKDHPNLFENPMTFKKAAQ